MRQSCRFFKSFGSGALVTTFFLGLLLALTVPWAAIVLLSLALLIALTLLVQLTRC